MTSEFEKRAAQAAVDAVERRWQRDADLKRRQVFRKRLVSALAWLFLLVVAVGCLWGYLTWKKGGNLQEILSLDNLLSSADRIGQQVGLSEGPLDEYARIVERLLSSPVKLSKELPVELKPKQAAQGTTYWALCRNPKKEIAIFSFVADGQGGILVSRLSPLTKPLSVEFSEFKKFRNGSPYLVVVGDSAYLYGSSKLKDAETLRAAVRAAAK